MANEPTWHPRAYGAQANVHLDTEQWQINGKNTLNRVAGAAFRWLCWFAAPAGSASALLFNRNQFATNNEHPSSQSVRQSFVFPFACQAVAVSAWVVVVVVIVVVVEEKDEAEVRLSDSRHK